MPAGRPTKYKKQYPERLVKHMSEGLSFESFAGVIDVDRDTIYEWAKVHPEFSDAKKRGTQASRVFWEKMGRAGASGKLAGFNSGTWIFNMKNRFSWRDKQETIVRDETMKDARDMNEEELESRIAHALKVIEQHESGTSKADNKGKTKATKKTKQSKTSKK